MFFKSFAELLVVSLTAVTTVPSDRDFDLATVTCEHFMNGSEQFRRRVVNELRESVPPLTTSREQTSSMMFRIDLGCIVAPAASVMQLVAKRQGSSGKAETSQVVLPFSPERSE